MTSRIEKISEFIFQSHKSGETFLNLENDMKPQDFAEAYEIQKRLRQKLPRGPLGGYKIALSSKIQQDYHRISQPVYGGLFKKEIFNSLGLQLEDKPTTHFIDNRSAKFIAESLDVKRSKHMDVKYHWIRQKIASKDIKLEFIRTHEQLADALTKALLKSDFVRLRDAINSG